MKIATHNELLQALIATTKSSDVRDILQRIGDRPELSVDEPFGSGPYHWHFYGDRESNMSTINLASKAGRSLTERVTNAIDAVLEARMAKGGQPPNSPMEAAKKWFGRPPTGADTGLFTWTGYSVHEYDKLVHVAMTLGDKPIAPTIDVVDAGIGIAPEQFPNTILGLQQGNKIKKLYLTGAWGQGGASTLSFSDYVLIISRHVDSPETVGFTVARLMKLGRGYKEDAYVYLAVKDEAGNTTVPSCRWEDAIELYPGVSYSKKPEPFVVGTAVRHYGYRLNGLEKTLQSSPGNLWHMFQYMMFDPLIPFRLLDLRQPGAYKNELISGSRNRLMKQAVQARTNAARTDDESASEGGGGDDEGETEERGTELRHSFPREMVSPRSDAPPCIGVEYWVALSRRKSGDKVKLRPHSNELFVDRGHPILGTLYGQNQGELTGRILSELQLSLVAKHIVIHIDSSLAPSDVRRDLFTSTREGFKEGETLAEVTRVLTNMLRGDDELYVIERELVDTLLRKGATEVSQEVKKQITSLLRDAGLEVKEQGEVLVAGGEGPTVVAPPRPKPKRPARPSDPLPTRPYPEVTSFEIVFPRGAMSVRQLDNHLVRVETDADFRYGREERLAIRVDPPKLEVASVGLLQGGRMNWRLRPTDDSQPGDLGEVIATLTKPDGSQMESRIMYEVLPPREETTHKAKGLVPPFHIDRVDPDQDPDTFYQVWDDLEPGADITKVAYRVMHTQGQLNVYYSAAFGPYKEQVERMKRQPTMASMFNQNYEVWIGYHSILQWQQRSTLAASGKLDEEQLSRFQEHERAVVATMQVKQALKMAEFQEQVMKISTSASD